MDDYVDDDPVRQATMLLAMASEGREDNFLVMTTTDLLELLRAGGINEDAAKELARRAFHEFNAPKLAHLDSTWGRRDRAE